MTDPVRDDEALFELFDYARNHPDNWNQNHWRLDLPDNACGTTYCLAGFKTWVLDERPLVKGEELPDYIGCEDRNGNHVSAEWYAQRELGLTSDESFELFHCYDHSQIETVVKNIMNDEYRG